MWFTTMINGPDFGTWCSPIQVRLVMIVSGGFSATTTNRRQKPNPRPATCALLHAEQHPVSVLRPATPPATPYRRGAGHRERPRWWRVGHYRAGGVVGARPGETARRGQDPAARRRRSRAAPVTGAGD